MEWNENFFTLLERVRNYNASVIYFSIKMCLDLSYDKVYGETSLTFLSTDRRLTKIYFLCYCYLGYDDESEIGTV